ncbi:MAG: BamA/OMP85 family outer membrane protein, partial [Vicinamibacterales bacterium]
VADRLVTAAVTVVEGPRSVVGKVTFEGNASIEASRLQAVAGLASGQPFYEPQTEMAADAIVVEYLNRGYPTARVVRTLTPSDDRTVDIAFRVQEGVQVIIDHILIVGNERTKTEIIERELVLKPGQPLADTDMIESRRRLNALGLFRRVQITDVRHPGEEARRDVLVTVEESLATTIGGGGGAEVGLRLERSAEGGLAEERIEFAPRGFFEIGRRNLWGKNRSINFFSRVSFRPNGGSATTNDPDTPADSGYGFNEYRVLLTYREPRVFGSTADGLLYGFLEQGVRSSFNFNRRGTRLEIVRRVTLVTTISGRYTLEQTRRFDERYNQSEEQNIDRLFPEFRLSALSSSLIRSTRDDAIDPTRGTLTTVDASFAARALGSQVGFVEVLLKEFFYRQLPGTGRVVFAGGATVGLTRGSSSNITETPNGETDSEQLTVPASERFYAGGDTTVRGFALDRLGTRDTIDQDGFPTGGQGLVIFNAELRFPVWGDLGGVGFLDVGNVYPKVTAINFGELRGSVGLGVRYRSPIGPIRFDIGFKLSRFDFRTGALNPDGTPETKLEPPTGFHISLGQAF